MARVSALNASVIAAMEELGLEGWIAGYRPRSRSGRRERVEVRDATATRQEIRVRSAASTKPVELAGMIGLGVLATGTAVWAFQRFEGPAVSLLSALTHDRPALGQAGTGSRWVRGALAFAGLVCGLGVVAASALTLLHRASRRTGR